jgi:4-amino-4-deoxy-L-arabinose transferase-like glycosyltransferase
MAAMTIESATKADSPLGLARSTWEFITVAIATVVGFAIRLYHLAAAPLSLQEIYTWDFSHQTLPFIVNRLSHIETNPPVYYLLIKAVMKFGETEFLLRFPSVIAGTLAIPLVYVLGRVGGASTSGVVGAALTALSAIAITYSRQARSYALAQDACLLAAIGVVVVIGAYTPSGKAKPSPRRGKLVGWALFTFSSIMGFYLHYTFLVEILILEGAIILAWLGPNASRRLFLLNWLGSSLLLALGMSWGLVLALSQTGSDDIAWMPVPSLGEAARLLLHVDGYTGLFRLQPGPSLLLVAIAALGVVIGWRRSAAVRVCGLFFGLFPLVLFFISQFRPMFIDRILAPSGFAVCLLAGYGMLFLAQAASRFTDLAIRRGASGFSKLPLLRASLPAAAIVVLLLPAVISAANSVRRVEPWQPYNKVASYLASTVMPGDVAAGPDGVIYYCRRIKASFPYFKLVEGNSSEAQVTYGSPTTHSDELARLASTGHWVFFVLPRTIKLVLAGKVYPSYSDYVLDKLGYRTAAVASFGELSIYRLAGACPTVSPCRQGADIGPR